MKMSNIKSVKIFNPIFKANKAGLCRKLHMLVRTQ